MKSAIVTIGTEITDGQIVDRNSAWISRNLEELNLNSILHVSVPDDRKLMIMALNKAMDEADLIFVCGGLGPTSDDFTRDIIAEVAGVPLVLDEPAWINVENKIKNRGLVVYEGHRRQAMIPKGARVLENSFGVAPAFTLDIGLKKMWTLPGPPREIEAVWKDHIRPELEHIAPCRTRHLTTFLTLGVAESDVANTTEEFFKPLSLPIEFGYRLSAPYVEVKIWSDGITPEISQAFLKYRQQIDPYYVGSTLREIHLQGTKPLLNYSRVEVFDGITQGLLPQKFTELSEVFKFGLEKFAIHTFYDGQFSQPAPISDNHLVIAMRTLENSNYEIQYLTKNKSDSQKISVPARRTTSYTKAYIIEKMFIYLGRLKN